MRWIGKASVFGELCFYPEKAQPNDSEKLHTWPCPHCAWRVHCSMARQVTTAKHKHLQRHHKGRRTATRHAHTARGSRPNMVSAVGPVSGSAGCSMGLPKLEGYLRQKSITEHLNQHHGGCSAREANRALLVAAGSIVVGDWSAQGCNRVVRRHRKQRQLADDLEARGHKMTFVPKAQGACAGGSRLSCWTCRVCACCGVTILISSVARLIEDDALARRGELPHFSLLLLRPVGS